ncbi:hypothetical protein V1477_003861 [Vespula maculifrons]|uniref:Uncharacterized protein n=1 Tax=Vespula maculifrons TaxID=7453 RepID=A0ABD2CS87_VESMC
MEREQKKKELDSVSSVSVAMDIFKITSFTIIRGRREGEEYEKIRLVHNVQFEIHINIILNSIESLRALSLFCHDKIEWKEYNHAKRKPRYTMIVELQVINQVCKTA